jgi:hypothetical protein
MLVRLAHVIRALVLTPIFVFLAGCVTAELPQITSNNPASPDAGEAISPPARRNLGTDQATEKTRELIAARAQQDSSTQQQDQKNQVMPGMQNMPGMQDEH